MSGAPEQADMVGPGREALSKIGEQSMSWGSGLATGIRLTLNPLMPA